jgi:hypothetical protein
MGVKYNLYFGSHGQSFGSFHFAALETVPERLIFDFHFRLQ